MLEIGDRGSSFEALDDAGVKRRSEEYLGGPLLPSSPSRDAYEASHARRIGNGSMRTVRPKVNVESRVAEVLAAVDSLLA